MQKAKTGKARVRFTDEKQSYHDMRSLQLTLREAGDCTSVTNRVDEWPTPSVATQQLWKSRAAVYSTYSPNYISTLQRMLWLLDVTPTDRFSAFEEACYKRAVAATTAAGYFVALMTLQKMLTNHESPMEKAADKRALKVLQDRAATHRVAFPQPMTLDHIRLIRLEFPHSAITTLIEMCWVLGQRIGDAAQTAVIDVQLTDIETCTIGSYSRKKCLTIDVRRGKVVGKLVPAYSLPLPWSSEVAQRVWALKEQRRKLGKLFMWTDTNSPEERRLLHAQIAFMITSSCNGNDVNLELRSIRRGGLQQMAKRFPLEKILPFSQHKSEAMLLRYLDGGKAAPHRLGDMMEVTREMTFPWS